MKIKAIIFDWDNTLVNTWPITLKALNITLKQFGFEEWSEEKLKQNVHFSVKSSFPQWFGDKAAEATKLYKKIYRDNNENLALLPGSLRLLLSAKQAGIKLAVISNKISENLKTEISQLGLINYFECIIGSNDTNLNKPEIEPMMLALKLMNLESRSVCYYGDTVTDMIFANNAGCIAIAFGADLAGNNKYFLNHEDFIEFLKL